MNLHPYLDYEVDYVWSCLYMVLLLTGVVALGGGMIYVFRKLIVYYKREMLVLYIRKAARETDGTMFLQLAEKKLFPLTACRLGTVAYTYPCEAWLEALALHSSISAVPPFRWILDACLQPSGQWEKMTAEEREEVKEKVIQLIRKWYV